MFTTLQNGVSLLIQEGADMGCLSMTSRVAIQFNGVLSMIFSSNNSNKKLNTISKKKHTYRFLDKSCQLMSYISSDVVDNPFEQFATCEYQQGLLLFYQETSDRRSLQLLLQHLAAHTVLFKIRKQNLE